MKTIHNYTAYPDEQLLLFLADSHQEAFTELYNRYHSGIYRYQLTFVKIPSIAEDLTQEVFIKIWEARHRMKVHTSFAAYLFRVSRNTAIDFMKKIAADKKLRNEIILHLQLNFPENSTNPLIAKEYEHLYQQAIESLSKQGSNVFRLCREEGKTYEEAAGILGISHQTVKEHMAKSLRNLRDFLSQKMDTALTIIIFLWLY